MDKTKLMTYRFFLSEDLQKNTQIYLQEDEHHHLAKVLRVQEEDVVELVNGKGLLAFAKVIRIEKNKTLLQIDNLEVQQRGSEQITIAVALMRPAKLEYIIEKATELGADRFILFPADLSTQENLSKEKILRLENIIISALKQSKRLFLPSLQVGLSLEEILSSDGKIYFGDVKENQPSSIPKLYENTIFITGPESGFSKNETLLLQKKAHGVRINPNILRAETAPIVALSLLCIQKT